MALSRINANSITDDSITVDQIADTAVHGRRNLVINGAMQVAQRGTSFASVGTAYTLDRFQAQNSSLGAFTVTQSSTAPDGFAKSLKWDCTTADASPAAGDFAGLNYRIEGQDLQQLKKGTSGALSTTVSFWVRSNKTGTYILEIVDADNSRNIHKAYTISSADTWEHKELTFAGDTTGTLTNDNGLSMYLRWYLGAGSTYTSGTLATDWQANVNADRAVGQVNLADSTSNEWYITGVQLEVGDKATPFEHRSYGEELALCQRYFHNTAPTGGSQYLWAFPIAGASQTFRRLSYVFPTTMRANPALVDGVGGVAGGSLQANKPTVESGWEGGTVVNLDLQSASDSAYCWFQSGGFDAEL